jgi:predicted DNA-binding transcriptional regulator AlpA
VTAATTDTAADHGPDLAPVSRSRRGDSLRAVSNARRHEHAREQRLLSLPQAQAALGGIGLTLLYKRIDDGSIRRVKIGRRAFITQASVDAFVASLTAA